MDTNPLRSRQTKFELGAHVAGIVLFLVISAFVPRWNAAGAAIVMAATYVLFIVAFFVLAHLFEKGKDGKVRLLLTRRQSWTFLFGGQLMPFVMVTAAASWEMRDRMPDYTQAGWWPVAGYLAGLAGGFFWRLFDNRRYHDLGVPSMLKSPTKWWVDYVQMPMGFALVLTWCLPALVAWGPYSGALAAQLGVVVLLMVADGLRKLEPRDQHVSWDPKRFKTA